MTSCIVVHRSSPPPATPLPVGVGSRARRDEICGRGVLWLAASIVAAAGCATGSSSSSEPTHPDVPPLELAVPEPRAEQPEPAIGQDDPLVVVPAEAPPTNATAVATWPRPQARARQTFTPRPTVFQLGTKLTSRWATRVGTTTFRTTMAMAGGTIVIGTHGRTLGGLGERDDGVYLLDATNGRVLRMLRPPGTGDLDVGGIALDGDRIYYGTDSGLLIADTLDGTRLWTAKLRGKVRAAPAIGDLDGNGSADVVVGDESGTLAAFDGATGQTLWSVATGANDYGARGFIGAAAIADLDSDGRDDVVAGARDGILAAYRGPDGRVLWQAQHSSGIHASASVADFDGDGQTEVLAAWSYGDVAVLDGSLGTELWGQTLQQDDMGIEALFASPIPLPGTPGVIVAPTSWWGEDDGVVAVGPLERAFKSFEGRVTASAVVTDLDDDGTLEAIVGTEKGHLIALHADGGRAALARLPGGIEATAMVADTNGDGTHELLVASRDGTLTCFETGSRSRPVVARFRGNDPRNRGELGTVRLGWNVPAGTRTPSSGVASAQGAVRIDYLRCCTDLQTAATKAPAPHNRLLLETSAACTALASKGTDRPTAMAEVARALGTRVPIPDSCR